jgi:putative membrane protein
VVSRARPFAAAEREQLDRAIATIKARTGARLNLIVTRVSDRYALYPLIWAGAAALLAGIIAALGWPELDDRLIVFIELAVLLLLFLLLDWTPLRLATVPSHLKHAHARQLAHREFALQSAAADPHEPQLLLFISLAERYAEIIGDHATHARVPGAVWHKIVDDLIAALKAGRMVDGVVVAIEACGVALEGSAPPPTP